MSRAKYYVFTLNNYTTAEETFIRDAVDSVDNIKYLCFGKEVGESGTPHLQGYVEFGKRIRVGAVKKISGFERVHLERRRGSQDQAIAYCKKEGDFHEFGEKGKIKQGQRKDLEEIKEALDSGASIREIAEDHFSNFIRYERGFRKYQDLLYANEPRDVQVFILWGKSGTGKTRTVFECFPDAYICPDPTLQWFDGYEGERVLLLDEYRGEASAAFILRFLDIYPIRIPVKGGFRPMRATKIFITSNMAPPFGHYDVEEAFKRRIKHTFRIDHKIYEDDVSLRFIKSIIQDGDH